MLIDTDVIIWYMRGDENAHNIIENQSGFFLSVITYMELVQGMRNKKELISLRNALREWDARIIYVTEDISAKAMFLIEQHYLAHSLQLADALIAATAVSTALPVLTGNDKHYRAIRELTIQRFRPSRRNQTSRKS